MTMKRGLTSRQPSTTTRKRVRSNDIGPDEVKIEAAATVHGGNQSSTAIKTFSRDRYTNGDDSCAGALQFGDIRDDVDTTEATVQPSSISSWADAGSMIVLDADRRMRLEQDQPQGIADHSLGSEGSSSSLDMLASCDTISLPVDMPGNVEDSLFCHQDQGCEMYTTPSLAPTERHPKRRLAWGVLALVALILAILVNPASELYGFVAHPQPIEKDTVCVSGGGFSGFWYIIGRLQSIPDPLEKNYYCYSAGCLGLVASFLDIAMEDVHEMAMDIQTRWNKGEISRFEVLTSFVDDMIHYAHNDTMSEQDAFEFLGRLNVLTTVRDGWWGLRTSTRTPTSVQSLKKLLIQTAWIPFATGNSLFHHGHMDGAFSLLGHPRCETSVGLPANLDIVANVVNMNLSVKKVHQFWELGSQGEL